MDRNDCISQAEWTRRAEAAVLADALTNGRTIFEAEGCEDARAVVTRAIVELRRMSGATPEILAGALVEAAWSCRDDEQRRAYQDEARQIAAKAGSPSVRRTVFAATR